MAATPEVISPLRVGLYFISQKTINFLAVEQSLLLAPAQNMYLHQGAEKPAQPTFKWPP